MGRWITFDPESLTAIAAVTTVAPELHDAKPGANQDALGVALASNHDAVLLMPTADSEHVIVAHIRHIPAAVILSERRPNSAPPERADFARDGVEPEAARVEEPPSPAIASPAPIPEPQHERTPEGERTPVYEAGGFLGLRDVPVYDDEPARPKKWWQKLLD